MPQDPPSLIGRDQEISALAGLVGAAAGTSGSALLLVGEPGMGKTALAGLARGIARDSGLQTLLCHGGAATEGIGFAGLHELLHPVLNLLGRLPERQRSALGVAFGFEDGPPGDPLVIGVAALGLLEEAAASRPLFVVVEDLHWLDPSSAAVVTFVASRLRDTPIALLATTRPVTPHADHAPSFPEQLRIEPLGRDDARRVLARIAPELRVRERDHVIAQAQGNPLALTELGAIAATSGRGTVASDAGAAIGLESVSLTSRIERVFLADVATLPERAQRAVALAAAGDDLGYREVLDAAAQLGLPADAFDAAERAGLVRVDGDKIVFRHPLVRSAVYESTGATTRSTFHRALADVARDGTLATWHRAAATLGWDEGVARELEEAADRATRQGARREAARAWHRAAELSSEPAARARRLARAAELSRQAGLTTVAGTLIDEAGRLVQDEATVLTLARSEWLLQMTTGRGGRGPDALVDLAASSDSSEARAEVLVWAATSCFVLQEPPAVRERVHRALLAQPDDPQDPLRRVGLALVDPTARDIGDVAELMTSWSERSVDSNAPVLSCLAFVAEERADLAVARTCWTSAVTLFHGSGRVSDEAVALCGRASVHATLGHLDEAVEDAEQSLRLCDALDLPVVAANAAAHLARARANRGEVAHAEKALELVAALSGPERVARVDAGASWAAGLLAAVDHRYADAVDAIARTRVNAPVALWAGADLVESAVRADRTPEAQVWLESAQAAAETTGSEHLRMLLERARGLLTEDDGAAEHFARAVEHGTRTDAVLDLARTRLAYGEWLRRRRRVVAARAELQSALDGFVAQGAQPWAERARVELRATGATSAPGGRNPSLDQLTAQELHVARLAAQGMSNAEIADQVYLSRRTVGAHLHRAFAKLQVAHRGQLAAVIGAPEASGV